MDALARFTLVALVALATTLALAPSAPASLGFSAPVSFDADGAVNSLAVADFNADGKPDIATANAGDGTSGASVLLDQTAPGAATPLFGGPTPFTTGVEPVSIATADINLDGKPDLVTANSCCGGNGASVLLNTTPGGAATASFAGPSHFVAGAGPTAVALGDLNADGKPDLVTSVTPPVGTGSVEVLLNTTSPGAATPSFTDAVPFAAGSKPSSVAIGDLDGDGRPDLAVTDSASTGPNGVLALVNATPNGATTPSFGSPAGFATRGDARGVAIGDLDSDGRSDLAIADSAMPNANLSLLHNSTIPGAAAPTFSVEGNGFLVFPSRAVTVADVNRDERPDLLYVLTSGGVFYHANYTSADDTKLSFPSMRTYDMGAQRRALASADFNADGKPDLVAGGGSGGTGAVSVQFNEMAPSSVLEPASSLEFGSVPSGATGEPRTLTVNDVGELALRVNSVALTGGDTSDFVVSGEDCTRAVVPPRFIPTPACNVRIRFAPTAEGPRSATLTVVTNAPESPQTVTLSGNGAPPLPTPELGASPDDGGTESTGGVAPSTGLQVPAPRAVTAICAIPKARKGKPRSVTCSIRLAKRATTTAVVRLTRGKTLYARATTKLRKGSGRVALTPRRKLTRGDYTLTLAAGPSVAQQRLTIR
jgi:FG-GAP-like repeat/FG-GAP repeat